MVLAQTILSNGTITISGSSTAFIGFGNNETSLVINITGPVTGSSPTIIFTIQEVDPGNQTTTLGVSKSGAALTGVGTQIITIPHLTTGSIIISWVVTGSSPSFGGIYATLVDKLDTPYIYDLAGNGPVAVKAASVAAVATDPALVVAVSPGTPVVISTVSPTASTGLVFGQANTGGSANTLASLRATTYTEQTTNAQRSVKSTSTNDTNTAGTGARQIKITYYDQTMAGPFTETISLNGTTAVNTVSTTICFIEKIVVTSVGSTKSNQGTITLFTTTAGGGTAIGTIAVGSVVSAGTVGDNQTLWAHHYVATGKTASVTTISSGTAGNQSGVTFLRSVDPTSATAVEIQITDSLVTVSAAGSGSIFRAAGVPLKVVGPSRITQYAVSNGTNTVFYGGFEYSEQ